MDRRRKVGLSRHEKATCGGISEIGSREFFRPEKGRCPAFGALRDPTEKTFSDKRGCFFLAGRIHIYVLPLLSGITNR